MTTATMPNSKPPRKQLSDQLDRLDGILDALSEGLNGAVADAAREGVQLAVKDAVIEMLTDSTLRARLHEATAPEPVPTVHKPGLGERLKAKVGQAVQAVATMATDAAAVVVRGGQCAAAIAANGVRAVRGFGRVKALALVGLGVGLAVGAASFLARHAVASAVAAISGVVATAAVQVGVWTRRACRAFTTA
jgi:hypothetical protein